LRRERSTPRPNWRDTIHEQGLVFDIPGRDAAGNARPYWDESVHYVFAMDEVLSIEADVEVLHSMCLDAVDNVITTERYRDFGIAEWVWPGIAESWRRSDPYLYGRFDLRYDGSGPAKMLEYNADTPTSLVEAAVVQWFWKTGVFPDDDQWNSIHEKLVARWAEIGEGLPSKELHFTWSGADTSGEDHVTISYLQETAAEAGLNTVGLAIEPLWKMLLSNKALLAVLWEMHPGHPNLLPAYLDQPGMLTEYVRKPKLGREGANIQIVAPGHETTTGGVYGREGYVYQLFDPLPEYDGYRPALGAWVVGDEAAGLGIRETAGLITDDGASFVPHRIVD
jgi:glutathionylspermidine synthase